jgi:hypothetical protein
MKTLISKLNEIFNKSNNIYLRFIISFLVVLTPFILFSFIIFIGLKNYLRAVVFVLFILISFFEKTKDNKLVLAFIGFIPMGFYIVTSPIFLGYIAGVQALNIGGILWDNKIMALIGSISIYGTIKTLKGASSIYEWFVNTGIGGYFFPTYKDLQQQINVKNQTITQLITENNSLVTSLKTVKDALKQLQLTAIDTFTRIEDKLYKQQEQILVNQPQTDIIIPVQDNISTAQLHQQLGNAIAKSDLAINNAEILLSQHDQNMAIINQQSNIVIPVSDSTFTAIQKVITGGAILFGGEKLIEMLGGDGSILVQGFNMAKDTLGPWMILPGTATAYAVGELAIQTITNTTNIAKKTVNTITSVYRESQKLILKGIMNVVENTTSVPNTTQIQLKEHKLPKNFDFTPGNVLDISLIRKPGYRDFINPDDLKPSTFPNSQSKQHGIFTINQPENLKSTLPPKPNKTNPTSINNKSILDTPHTWIS